MKPRADKKSVMITGSSSGIGRACVRLFHRNGWRVIATMRQPELETEFVSGNDLLVLALDVTKPDSIDAAVAMALQTFGSIDVVVNNAGYALMGAFETTSPEQVRRQFETNVFGLMAVCRQLLPHFRSRNTGILINVASMAGRLPIPLMSVYNASKWAVEGFSECLRYELSDFAIRVKIIEPGAVNTAFFGRSSDRENATGERAYEPYSNHQFPVLNQTGPGGISSENVAQVIYRAATDGSSRTRYPIGVDAKTLLTARRVLPDAVFLPLLGWSLQPRVFKLFGRAFYRTEAKKT